MLYFCNSKNIPNTTFFHKQRFFSIQPQYCLTCSWIELQMFLRCCLMHKTRLFIFTIFGPVSRPRSTYVVSMWSYFHFFAFIFIMINRTVSWIQTHLFYCLLLEYVLLFLDDDMDDECEEFSNSKISASGCCLALAQFFAKFRGSHLRCSVRKGVLRNISKFKGKHLCQSLFFNKVASLRCSFILILVHTTTLISTKNPFAHFI